MEQKNSFNLKDLLSHKQISSNDNLLYFKSKQIKVSLIDFNKQKVLDVQNILLQRYKNKVQSFQKKNWRLQQLQFLFYILDKFCYLNKTTLQQLTDDQWMEIITLLPGRQLSECKFKALSLKRYSLNQFPWEEQQQKIFQKIVAQQGMKWDTVSKKLHQMSKNKNRNFFRNSKQCRQHFLCFMNPNIKKGPWNQQQDFQLVSLYIKYGRKWSKMSRTIRGRNQNAIKNRFFLLVENKFKKNSQSSKVLQKNYLQQANKLKQKYQKKLGTEKCNQLISQKESSSIQQINDISSSFKNEKIKYKSHQLQNSQINMKQKQKPFEQVMQCKRKTEDQIFQSTGKKINFQEKEKNDHKDQGYIQSSDFLKFFQI